MGPNAKLKVWKAPQWSLSAKTLQKNESQVRKKARRHKDPLSLKTSWKTEAKNSGQMRVKERSPPVVVSVRTASSRNVAPAERQLEQTWRNVDQSFFFQSLTLSTSFRSFVRCTNFDNFRLKKKLGPASDRWRTKYFYASAHTHIHTHSLSPTHTLLLSLMYTLSH